MDKPTTTPAKRKKASRRIRRVRTTFIVLLVLVAAYFLLTQSFLTRWIVMGIAGHLTGGDASASSVTIGPRGRIIITDGKLRAPGVPGDAGVVFSVKRLAASFQWTSLFSGPLNIWSIDLDHPLARISQSIDDGTVNLAALDPPKGNKKRGLKNVPRVVVTGGVIELGEHITYATKHADKAPVYTALKKLDVGGEVKRSPDEKGASIISFSEVEGAVPVAGGLTVTGRVADDGIRLTLEGFSLSSWSADSLPSFSSGMFRERAMQGEVPRATITYDYAGGWEARIELRRVAVNLPVKARVDDAEDLAADHAVAEPDRLLRMENVEGYVTFTNKGASGELAGTLEELPYEVQFSVDGTSPQAAFSCTLVSRGFELTKSPQIMRFAPHVVRKRLAQFNNPTGIVDARVVVTRGQPVSGQEGPLGVSGTLLLREGVAAFEKFPYEFIDMTAEISFDDSKVSLDRIDAVAPGGVKVHATGIIAPPNDDAMVEINVSVTNMPVDDRLAQALRGRKRVLDELFNAERYRQLIEAGLLASSEQHAVAAAELKAASGSEDSPRVQALRQILARPVFDLGGRADVEVKVTREAGPDSEWFDLETIHLRNAGVVPREVPLPMIADNVTIIKRDDSATLENAHFRGVTGGTATASATVNFDRMEAPGTPFVPEVQISARGVPIDDLFLNALPETGPLSGELSLEGVMRALHLSGTGDADVTIGMSPEHTPAFHVHATFNDVKGAPIPPRREAPRLSLANLAGTVDITQDHAAAALTTNLGSIEDPSIRSPVSVSFSLPISTDSKKPSPVGGLDATIESKSFDTRLVTEDIVAMLAPSTAAMLAERRDVYQPVASLSMRTTLHEPEGIKELTTQVALQTPLKAEFSYAGSRIGLDARTGEVVFVSPPAGSSTIALRALEGDLQFNGETPTAFTATGLLPLEGGPASGSSLKLAVPAGRFESALTRTALTEFGPKALADTLASSNVRGGYRLELSLAPNDTADRWDASGVLSPSAIDFSISNAPIAFTAIQGSIEFGNGDGHFRDLGITAPTWSSALSGSWTSLDNGGTSLQTTFSISAQRLAPDLRALLPGDLTEELDTLSFSTDGPITIKDNQLALAFDAAGKVTALKGSGQVSLRSANLDVGVLITALDGTLDYSIVRPGPDVRPEFQLWGLLDSFAATGISMTDGRIRVISGDEGEVLVPLISADCHGGRVAGSAVLFSPSPRTGRRRFEGDVHASDIRLASLIANFDKTLPADPKVAPDVESRGRLDAGLTLGGIAGDPTSRRGRGTITIGGGRIVTMPLLIPIMRVMNLQFPVSERVDYALAEFYLQGNQAVFTELSASSESVAVYGYGTASLPDFELDLRFKTKNRTRIPVLTRVVEGVRDELLVAVVNGTLGKPDVHLAALPGATRIFERVFGGSVSARDRRLNQIERRAESDPRRRQPDREAIAPR